MTANKWYTKEEKDLFKTFLLLKTVDEVASFCRDLMTQSEITEFAQRWQIAQDLNKGKSQRRVAADQNASISTVTRVNQWLIRGLNGYKTAINRSAHQHRKVA